VGAGSRMSRAVIHNDLIWLSGQVGTGGTSITEQTREILAEIDNTLAECGSSKSRALQVVIWLSSMDHFEEMNAVYDAWIDPDNPPARACGESRLASDDLNVEITVTAAK